MNNTKTVITRTFLLKNKPTTIKSDEFYIVEKCYKKEGGKLFFLEGKKDFDKKTDSYRKVEEQYIEPDVLKYQDLGEIEQKDFVSEFNQSEKKIGKLKYVFNLEGVTWEIDEFMNMNLILAKARIPDDDYTLKIPKEIGDVLITSVSDKVEFSDYNLSGKIE